MAVSSQLRVRLTPRANRNAVQQVRGGDLRAWVTAPPVNDAANDALLELLARLLDHPKSRLSIVSGRASRDKRIGVEGLAQDEMAARISKALDRV